MRISVFEKIDKTGSPLKNPNNELVTYSIDTALNIIKNHPNKDLILKARESGKADPDKKYTDTVWEYYTSKAKKEQTGKSGEYVPIHRNYYDHIKSTKIQCVTWTTTYSNRRRKSDIESFSSYIYLDIDDFNDISFEKVWEILTDGGLSFVKAVWRSFGGNGIGCLVKVKNVNVDNYKSTWGALAKLLKDKFSIKVDAQTKDVTRINVLSYDPNIFIKPDEKVLPYYAVEPKQTKEVQMVDYKISDSAKEFILFDLFQIFYTNEDSWNRSEDRLSYGFYQKYFSYTNKYGLTQQEALGYLVKMKDKYSYLFKYREYSEVEYFCEKQYSSYYDQHGKIDVVIKDDLPLEEQYIITSFYKQYTGNVALKLEAIYNNLKNKNYDVDKICTVFSIISKEVGILTEPVIKYLNSQLNDYENITFLVESIYKNPKYKFGLVKEFTVEALKEKKRIFIENQINKGKRILDYTKIVINTKEVLNKIISDCYAKNGKPSDKNITYFLKNYFLSTLSYGIEVKEALDFLLLRVTTYSKLLSYAKFYSEEIYEYYKYRFGIRTVNQETVQTLANRFDVEKKLYLPNDKKLSHLKLNFQDNTIIWANTNMGKTTYICNDLNQKRLILVPVIGALENIEQRFNSSVFYGDKKNVKDGDNLIVCTYSSFHLLVKRMSTWETPISEYDLYIDEMHNFAVSSEKSFRNKELNYILDNMHMFKKRVLLTGTLFPILHPKLMNFKVWRITWESTPEKEYNIVNYENIYKAISSRLIKGKKNIIYLQNKKEEGEMGKLIDYLNMQGWDNIQCINADEKYSSHFRKLITEEYIEDHVEVLICTSIMVEALNILNEDIGTLHFMSFENPILLEQMANRTRKVLPEKIYLYKKIKEESTIEDEGDINVIDLQKELIQESDYLLNYFARPVNMFSQSYSKVIAEKIKRDQLFEKNSLVRIKDQEYVVDYLSISNLALKAETVYSFKEPEYMGKALHEYNWVLSEVEYDTENILEQEKVSLNNLKEEKNEELLEDIKQILEDIKDEGEKLVKDRISENKVKALEKLIRPRHQIMLRQNVSYLCNFMDFDDSLNMVTDWVYEHNLSSRIWSKIIRQIHFKLGQKKGLFENENCEISEFEIKLMEFYNNRKSKDAKTSPFLHTKKQLIATVNKHIDLHPVLTKDHFNEDNILDFLKRYFELIPKLDKNNKVKYILGGLNYNLDLVVQTSRIFQFIRESIKEDKNYTTDQLFKIVSSFRKDLPFFKKIKLTNKNVMLLLGDCSCIENAGMVKIYGKRTRIYKFKNLTGKYIQNIEVIPQRNISIHEKHVDDLTGDEKLILDNKNKDSNEYFATDLVDCPF